MCTTYIPVHLGKSVRIHRQHALDLLHDVITVTVQVVGDVAHELEELGAVVVDGPEGQW